MFNVKHFKHCFRVNVSQLYRMLRGRGGQAPARGHDRQPSLERVRTHTNHSTKYLSWPLSEEVCHALSCDRYDVTRGPQPRWHRLRRADGAPRR